MHALLFIFYAVVLSALLSRSAFIRRTAISPAIVIALFIGTVLAGSVHNWIAYRYFPGHGDIWQVFEYSLGVKHRLLHDFSAFRQEFFPEPFAVDLTGKHLGWTTDELQELAVVQVLLNFLSFDNHYINVLLFCFVTTFGKIALLRVLRDRYPRHEVRALAFVFFIPSVVFWTSVIHKEAILFAATGVLILCFHRMLREEAKIKHWLVAVLMFALIFVTRKMMALFLIPALGIWWISDKKKISAPVTAATVWGSLILALFLAAIALPSLNPLAVLARRQHEFFQLKGSSQLELPWLGGSAISFLRAAPHALLNGLLMPLPGSGGHWLYSLFGVELLVIYGILLTYFLGKKRERPDGLQTGFFVFAVVACIIIGYTVPFAGAIVRYRSVLLIWLLVPVLSSRRTKA